MHRSPSCIAQVTARQILTSKGRPTVEADVILEDGSLGRASTPSGTSTGRYEACELRDGDAGTYRGHGVLAAIQHVRGEIAAHVTGLDALDQNGLDASLIRLDGSPSLKRLGANAILATSMAVARAAASHLRQPLYRYVSRLASDSEMSLPMPMTNMFSGMDFQDFLAIPVGATSYSNALEMIWRAREAAADLMKRARMSLLLADDGGLSPGFQRADQALELMVRSFEAAGLEPGVDIAIGLDVAASELFAEGRYSLSREDRRLSSAEMIEYLVDLAGRFPIISIEDALDQDDWEGWRKLRQDAPGLQIVGDDLFATNLVRVQRGIAEGTANAAVVKLNQNGTLSGTLAVIAALRSAALGPIVAARSGDTEDTFIADLAVGTGAGQIKIGAIRNTERLGKYNQLLRIEEEAGLPFAGSSRICGARRAGSSR